MFISPALFSLSLSGQSQLRHAEEKRSRTADEDARGMRTAAIVTISRYIVWAYCRSGRMSSEI